jgi:hypothetical protein
MAISPETNKNLPSQESLLLDYVRRLEKHRQGRMAVHIRLSNLRPFNRKENHLRAAAECFEDMVKAMRGQLFRLNNSDFFFVFKGDFRHQAETVVQKVRFMFGDDPLLDKDQRGEKDFDVWYDVESDEDYETVLHFVQNLALSEAQKNEKPRVGGGDTRASLKARQTKGEPMTPDILNRVENALRRADLSNLVRRQFVCRLDSNMVPEQVFSEMYISIPDLRETLLPGVNMAANRWLFQHLTETLDRRMLAMLTKTDHLSISGDISFNINVATLLASEFQDFDDNVAAARRGSMILELQMADIFADLGGYLFAREYVQEKGYRICLDGMTHDGLAMIDQQRLGVDLIKLFWHPDMVDGGEEMHERIRIMVRRAGVNRTVLCRVDNREAIDFGQSVGLSIFQGRYIESLIAEDNRRRDLLRLKMRIERSDEFDEE